MATLTDEAGAPVRAPESTAPPSPARPRHTLVVAVLVAIVGLVPLGVATIALRHPRWYPVGDLALIELRVRDVGTADTPLVGPPARYIAFGERGSHPGPISYWALAPVYRLLGSSPWALMASTAALHVAALGAAIAIAARRAGWRVALGIATGLALLLRAHGPETLTQPWNPYVLIVWWVVFLLAAWSVLCDDLPLLPVALVAGTFCMQTHISYLGLVAGVGGLAVAGPAVAAWRRGDRRDPRWRRQVLVWGGLSAVLLGVLWLPVALQQVTDTPGNLAIIRESIVHPDQEPTGLAAGADTWLTHLDLGRLIAGDQSLTGSPVPGVVLLAAWGAAAVAARCHRHHALVRLHGVIAAALALGLVSATRIEGPVIHYLVLWMWGTTLLTAAATAWTAIALTGRAASVRTATTGLAAVILVGASASLTVDAASAEPHAPGVSRMIEVLAQDTVEALRSGTVPGGGPDGVYLLRWDNLELPANHPDGLLLELERRGVQVGIDAKDNLMVGAGDHRVVAQGDATAVLTFVEGPRALARWRDDPAAVEVAAAEPARDAAAEFARLHRGTVASLRADGLDELADRLTSGNMLGPVVDPRFPDELIPAITRMVDIGLPAAVFVTTPPFTQT